MTKTSISDPELQQGLNSGNKRKPWQIVFLVHNPFTPMSLKSIFDVSEGHLTFWQARSTAGPTRWLTDKLRPFVLALILNKILPSIPYQLKSHAILLAVTEMRLTAEKPLEYLNWVDICICKPNRPDISHSDSATAWRRNLFLHQQLQQMFTSLCSVSHLPFSFLLFGEVLVCLISRRLCMC